MTRAEKQKELKRLLHVIQISDSCTTNSFTAWQGQVAAMLAFNPTLQAEFKEAVRSVPTSNQRSMWGHENDGPKANAAIRNVLSQAINELGLPEEKATAQQTSLTDDNNIWWFINHCTWKSRLMLSVWLLFALGTALGIGFRLGTNDWVRKRFREMITFSNPTPTAPPRATQPNK